MAQGDIKEAQVSVVGGADLVIQPASGECWKIKDVITYGDISVNYDPTPNWLVIWSHPAAGNERSYFKETGKGLDRFIGNTLYMKLHNSNSGSRYHSYIGIQIT